MLLGLGELAPPYGSVAGVGLNLQALPICPHRFPSPLRKRHPEEEGILMTYRCGNCDRTFEKIEATGIRCPYCGYRILFKVRPDVVRKVKAR